MQNNFDTRIEDLEKRLDQLDKSLNGSGPVDEVTRRALDAEWKACTRRLRWYRSRYHQGFAKPGQPQTVPA